MISLVGRRIFLAVVTLFIISLIVFMGVEALPGDSATAYLGQLATPESLAASREEFYSMPRFTSIVGGSIDR
jgi:peptide/nickel transport system permease protein